jgi:hypothetical protein
MRNTLDIYDCITSPPNGMSNGRWYVSSCDNHITCSNWKKRWQQDVIFESCVEKIKQCTKLIKQYKR